MNIRKKMMKRNIRNIGIALMSTVLISLTVIGCSSVFSGTVSGTVKYETKANGTSDESSTLSGATVYVFFDETEFDTYESKWERSDESKSASTTSDILPTDSETILSTTSNATGGFSISTMWSTTSPLFGSDGDREEFHVAVYHQDFGMIFDDTSYSLLSDSAQNISEILPYNENMVTYSVTLDLKDFADQNNDIALTTVSPNVTFKISNADGTDNAITKGGEDITSTAWTSLPTTTTTSSITAASTTTTSLVYSFVVDKYKWDASNATYTTDRIYPSIEVVLDNGDSDSRSYWQCTKDGTYIEYADYEGDYPSYTFSEDTTDVTVPVYVDEAEQTYKLAFNLKDAESKETKTTVQSMEPSVTLDTTLTGTVDGTLTQQFSYDTTEVPTDGYYTFVLRRAFSTENHETNSGDTSEVFPTVDYYLQDDPQDVVYRQVDVDGNYWDSDEATTTSLQYDEDVPTTTVDAYVSDNQRTYSLSFNYKDYTNNTDLTGVTTETFAPKVVLDVYMDGEKDTENSKTYAISELPTDGEFTFTLEKEYDGEDEIFPTVKYIMTDDPTDIVYVQTDEDGNILTPIKEDGKFDDIDSSDYQSVTFDADSVSQTADVYLGYDQRTYTINFSLENSETGEDVAFASMDPEVQLTYYCATDDSAGDTNTETITSSTAGSYSFTWEHALEGISNADDERVPTVSYLLTDNSEDAKYYQTTDDGAKVSDGVNEQTVLCNKKHTSKDVTAYVETAINDYSLTVIFKDAASNDDITYSEISPKTTLYIQMLNSDEELDTENSEKQIDSNSTTGVFSFDIDRCFTDESDPDTEVFPTVTINIKDKRSPKRYVQMNYDDSFDRTTLSNDADDDSYEYDSYGNASLEVEIKDLKIDDFDFEGTYVAATDSSVSSTTTSEADNKTVWIIPRDYDETVLETSTHDASESVATTTTASEAIGSSAYSSSLNSGTFSTTVEHKDYMDNGDVDASGDNTFDESSYDADADYEDDTATEYTGKIYCQAYFVVLDADGDGTISAGDYYNCVTRDNTSTSESPISIDGTATTSTNMATKVVE